MNNIELNNNINNIQSNITQFYDCPHCSASSILLSSNFNNKQYILYFQNDSIRLIEMDDIGMEVLGEVRVRYCMVCGRELIE